MTNREFMAIIDELWNTFWSSGISNPISVVEQMTYLIFFKTTNDKNIKYIKTFIASLTITIMYLVIKKTNFTVYIEKLNLIF